MIYLVGIFAIIGFAVTLRALVDQVVSHNAKTRAEGRSVIAMWIGSAGMLAGSALVFAAIVVWGEIVVRIGMILMGTVLAIGLAMGIVQHRRERHQRVKP
jgi:hypothetical protein